MAIDVCNTKVILTVYANALTVLHLMAETLPLRRTVHLVAVMVETDRTGMVLFSRRRSILTLCMGNQLKKDSKVAMAMDRTKGDADKTMEVKYRMMALEIVATKVMAMVKAIIDRMAPVDQGGQVDREEMVALVVRMALVLLMVPVVQMVLVDRIHLAVRMGRMGDTATAHVLGMDANEDADTHCHMMVCPVTADTMAHQLCQLEYPEIHKAIR